MGTEYLITFEPDERYSFPPVNTPAGLWPTYRPRLEARLRALPGASVRGTTLEFRTPDEPTRGMPSLAIEIRDAEIYACEYGDAKLASDVLGVIMRALVNEGFRAHFAMLE